MEKFYFGCIAFIADLIGGTTAFRGAAILDKTGFDVMVEVAGGFAIPFETGLDYCAFISLVGEEKSPKISKSSFFAVWFCALKL